MMTLPTRNPNYFVRWLTTGIMSITALWCTTGLGQDYPSVSVVIDFPELPPILPNHFGPTFSVDFQGPTAGFNPGAGTGVSDSFYGAPIDEGQILTPPKPGPPGPNAPSPGPLPAPGIMVDSVPGSPVGTAPGGLGILPGLLMETGVELDALSYGRDRGSRLYFSVDEFAGGDVFLGPTATPNVSSEGIHGNQEASADVFTYLGPAVPTASTSAGSGPGNRAVIDGNGLAPHGSPGLGLVEPNPVTADGRDRGDNLDALDIDTTREDVFGKIFFSLDSKFSDPLEGPPVNTATAISNGFVGGDVLVTAAGAMPMLYAPATSLGLDLVDGEDSDDLDSLILLENGDGKFTPHRDFILFSVRRGSAVIGSPDSRLGLPIEEGDVLTIPKETGGLPAIFIPAESLGLGTIRSKSAEFQFGDELDALDLSMVPEPSSMVLTLLGILTWFGCFRRRTVKR